MNEATLTELKAVVERVVRPVRATMTRKRRMREELLAHLVAVFEQEAEKLGDAHAALEHAKQRFGNPRELTAQLEQTVPRWNRCQSILENMGYQSGESAWHLAVKHFLVALLIYILWLPTWMLVHGNLRDLGPAESQRLIAVAMVLALPTIALWNVVLSISLAPLLNKIGSALVSNRRRRILLAMLCGFVVLFGMALPPFTGAAILFVLMARQAVQEWHYQADWA